MNIGFVSTWFERGAAYVTKAYINAVNDKHNIFVYARGGESNAIGDPNWDLPYVTWGLNLIGTKINRRHFSNWVKQNNIDTLFFNEQRDYDILIYLKKNFPKIKLGAYIDYYKEDEIDKFELYDFLICNTKRHYSVFKDHPQCFYVPWGTDIDVFKPQNTEKNQVTFFHSVGMSLRKGTDVLLKTFIEKKLYKESKLIIHTQINLEKHFGYAKEELHKYNIEVIEKSVGAPGLYHLGDVYVYPTTLDGLGLTLYEALACGLPVITTNNPPMNEVVKKEVGYLVDIEKIYSRSDGYYWPLSICSGESLAAGMMYYVDRKGELEELKNGARNYAVQNCSWSTRYNIVSEIFETTKILKNSIDLNFYNKQQRKRRLIHLRDVLYEILPDKLVNLLNNPSK